MKGLRVSRARRTLVLARNSKKMQGEWRRLPRLVGLVATAIILSGCAAMLPQRQPLPNGMA